MMADLKGSDKLQGSILPNARSSSPEHVTRPGRDARQEITT